MKIVFLNKLADPQGPCTTLEEHCFTVLGGTDKECIIQIDEKTAYISWCRKFDHILVELDANQEVGYARRIAEHEDFTRLRIPRWVQDEFIPECCDVPMFFVGQIDDGNLCCERPPDAVFWYHDAACFYVFTCSQCGNVEAFAQQY